MDTPNARQSASARAELEKIDAELAELFEPHHHPDSELVFLLGVRAGRILAANGIDEFRPQTFIQREIRAAVAMERNEKIQQLEDALMSLVRRAIREHVDELGIWSIATQNGHGDNKKFSQRIVDKYFVQFDEVTRRSGDDEYTLRGWFSFAGGIKAALEAANIASRCPAVIYTNDGSESLMFRSSLDVGKHLDYLELNVPSSMTADDVSKLSEEVAKPVLFLLMQPE